MGKRISKRFCNIVRKQKGEVCFEGEFSEIVLSFDVGDKWVKLINGLETLVCSLISTKGRWWVWKYVVIAHR